MPLQACPRNVQHRVRRRAREDDPLRRSRFRVGLHRRARRGGHGGGPGAEGRLLQAHPRDLRQVRRAAHLRRGHVRRGAHGQKLGPRSLERGARHDRGGQGAGQRLHAALRRRGQRADPPGHQGEERHLRPRPYLQPEPAVLLRRHCRAGLSEKARPGGRIGPKGRLSAGKAQGASQAPHRGRRAWAGAFCRHRVRQGQEDEGALRPEAPGQRPRRQQRLREGPHHATPAAAAPTA